ncbi:hypothetical protein Pfo_028666 [Paulownia fortunei]|nr:hypothetical protein Pfo_028666 [Paulownia fortunei]
MYSMIFLFDLSIGPKLQAPPTPKLVPIDQAFLHTFRRRRWFQHIVTLAMMRIKTPKNGRIKRELDKRAPKLVETGKKTLILHGTKTSSVLNSVLTEIYHLKKDNSFGSHSKKRPNNLVLGRTYDHHIYDLVEIGVENFRSMESFSYDKKLAPQIGSKPFFAFIGEAFESVDELKHLKEVLLDLFRGEVVTNLNLAGLDRVYVCTALSSNRIFFSHYALRLKKSGTLVPRMELVEVGPSMDMVVRRHRHPDDSLRKEAMKTAPELTKKKEKNVVKDAIQGKIGKIYIPDQKSYQILQFFCLPLNSVHVGWSVPLANKVKGLKREWREAKMKGDGHKPTQKKQKQDAE